MTHVFAWMDGPIGRLKLVASDRGLAAVLWESDRRAYRHLTEITEDASHPMLIEAKTQPRFMG